MTLKEYQKYALKTALYTSEEQAKACCRLGLIGEVGEVCELMKKSLRGDFATPEQHAKPEGGVRAAPFCEKLKKELGDVCWYAVTYSHYHQHELEEISFERIESTQNISERDLSESEKISLFHRFSETLLLFLEKTLTGDPPFLDLAEGVSSLNSLFGLDLSLGDIFQTNIEKLAKRKSEGTLKGSGSDR